MGSAARAKAARLRSVEVDGFSDEFRRDIQPLIAKMRKQFEAEDAALLAMHPGAPQHPQEQTHDR